jgi:glycosyltransferase involved in cell wall biosynthesis
MKISICTVTARNGFAETQAEFIAKQTHKDIEWVLVDFAFEARARLMKETAKKLGLKIIHSPNVRTNDIFMRDISRNRNKALALATGDAVIFLDDYAVIYPDFVEKHLDVLKDNAISAGMMYRHEVPTTKKFMDDIFQKDLWHLKVEYDLKFDPRNHTDVIYKSRETYTGNLGIPRTIFEVLNGFDPRMEGTLEDCDFGIRALMANFHSFFNPKAYTINLHTGDKPYMYYFDHHHDVEPFVAGPGNHYSGNINLPENDMLKIEFKDHYRTAHCKICGAKGIVDGTELMFYKQSVGEIKVPESLLGGYDTLRINK